MNPDDGTTIGASPGGVVIHRLRTDCAIAMRPDGARLLSAVAEGAPERVYLALNEVRGAQDATVLRVYLELSEGAATDKHIEFFAGDVGLYGLRRASVAAADHVAQGLRFVLDITAFFQHLRSAGLTAAGGLAVSIRIRRTLPVEAAIAIGQIVIFREDYRDTPRQ